MRAVAIAFTWVIGIIGIAAAEPDRITAAKQAVAAKPNDPTLRVKLAEALVEEQDAPGAIAAYEAAIGLDGKPPGPRLALATLYVNAGDVQRAAAMLRDVVRTSTDDDAVVRAGREAIDLAEMAGTLGELEQVLLPLATRPTHRRLLVTLYERWVPRLVLRARSQNTTARSQDTAARSQLSRIGTAAHGALLAALADPDPDQQRAAIAVLPHVGNPAAAPALVKLARTEPKGPVDVAQLSSVIDLQSHALIAAGQLGSPAVFEAVRPLMTHTELAIRDAATFTLGRTRDRRAIALLIAALDDRHTSTATLACLGLAPYRDPRVGPALIAMVSDARNHEVARAACAYVLGLQRLTASVPALTRVLGDSGELPRMAAWSLGQLADPATLGPLFDAYFAHGGPQRRELEFAIARASGAPATSIPDLDPPGYPETRGHYDAARVVSALPGELPPLNIPDRVFQAHADDIARAVVSVLASLDPAVVLGALEDLDALRDDLGFGVMTPRSPDAKTRAVLATITTRIEPSLTNLLASREPRVRMHALSIFTKAVGARAEPAILKALDDPERAVRDGAMAAIGQLARGQPVPEALRARLMRALASASWQDRRTAALAMSQLGAATDVGALVGAAGDPSGFVREAVATSLGAIASPATVDALIQLSRDDVPAVRVAAASALRPLGDPRARARTSELRGDPDPGVRAAAGP